MNGLPICLLYTQDTMLARRIEGVEGQSQL
jgi:hypothetical protein